MRHKDNLSCGCLVVVLFLYLLGFVVSLGLPILGIIALGRYLGWW